jgi:hypothetical protein
MPKLGETVTEGTIGHWLKAVGDTVAFDDALVEVSTDKVDTEIPSPYDGTVLEILVGEGDTVPVGTPLARIGAPGAAPAAAAVPAAAPATTQAPATAPAAVAASTLVAAPAVAPAPTGEASALCSPRWCGGLPPKTASILPRCRVPAVAAGSCAKTWSEPSPPGRLPRPQLPRPLRPWHRPCRLPIRPRPFRSRRRPELPRRQQQQATGRRPSRSPGSGWSLPSGCSRPGRPRRTCGPRWRSTWSASSRSGSSARRSSARKRAPPSRSCPLLPGPPATRCARSRPSTPRST